MLRVDLTNTDLFKSLIEFSVEDYNIDLHNEFDCDFFRFFPNKQQIHIGFSKLSSSSSKCNTVQLVFNSVQMKNLEFNFEIQEVKPTIDCLYKGRFESENGLLERDTEGRHLFYLSFVEDFRIEFFSMQVEAIVNS